MYYSQKNFRRFSIFKTNGTGNDSCTYLPRTSCTCKFSTFISPRLSEKRLRRIKYERVVKATLRLESAELFRTPPNAPMPL